MLALGFLQGTGGDGPAPLQGVELARTWADLINKAVLTIIAIGGVIWGYYKFVRGRTFRRRLTLTVSYAHRRRDGTLYLFATAEAENVGFSRIKILTGPTGLQVHTPTADVTSGTTPEATEGPDRARKAEWEELDFFPVFEDQEALEPGETASEEILIELPDRQYAALRLDLWVFSTDRIPWYGTAVANLLPPDDNGEARDPNDVWDSTAIRPRKGTPER